MHTINITPNLLFEYQCTSSKFIRLPNRIEKIDSVPRIESKLFLLQLECCSHHECSSSKLCTAAPVIASNSNSLEDVRRWLG